MAERVAIYYRISTADQTPDAQMNELRSYAERREFEVAAEYIETASGAVRSRPQLDRMLRDVRSRKADIVLVWAFDSSGCRYLDSQQPCHWLIEYQAVSS